MTPRSPTQERIASPSPRGSRANRKTAREQRPGGERLPAAVGSIRHDSSDDAPSAPRSIVTLDLEGVLVPEIWIAVAERTGIDALRRTTRDEPDYDVLMRYRLDLLAEHGLTMSLVADVIGGLDPLPGAAAFLDELRRRTQVIILSDTFEQFAAPLMAQLGMADDPLPPARGRGRPHRRLPPAHARPEAPGGPGASTASTTR